MANDKQTKIGRVNEDLTKSFTHTSPDIPGNPPASRNPSQGSQSQGSQGDQSSSQSQQQSSSSDEAQ